jgi:predicted ferric reductase
MKNVRFIALFFGLFALGPLYLAVGRDVSALSTYQYAVLFVSLSAFGLLIGLFWMTRLLPRRYRTMRLPGLLRWHKAIGYLAGLFLLLHPVLVIGRRFMVEETLPLDNLRLMLSSPLLQSGVAAWVLLLVMVFFGVIRRALPAKFWRIQHGLCAVAFSGFATWHVVAVGRHSNLTMSVFWIGLAASGVAAWLLLYFKPAKREIHESA